MPNFHLNDSSTWIMPDHVFSAIMTIWSSITLVRTAFQQLLNQINLYHKGKKTLLSGRNSQTIKLGFYCRGVDAFPELQHALGIRNLELSRPLLHPLQKLQFIRCDSPDFFLLRFRTSLSKMPSSTMQANLWHLGSLVESGAPISTPSSLIRPPFLSARSST